MDRLTKNHENHQTHIHQHHARRSTSQPTKNHLIKSVVLAPVKFYRRYLSPLKSTPSCRFQPTCSEYAVEAVETRGVIVGMALAIWRVLRCHPFNKGGYDPVPQRRSKSLNGEVSTEAT